MVKNRKILIVDDDRLTLELMSRTLSRAGYEVIFAEDGAAALEMAANENPDLVLTDGLLPKMHGFLVCESIKKFDNPPKVVIITGVYTKPTYKWEVKKEHGADDVLTKPVTPARLLEIVENQLADLPPDQIENEGVNAMDFAVLTLPATKVGGFSVG